MRRARRHRQEPARELVHALRSALELADAALDAEIDRLVVAGFEMQARHEFGRAPVAAPERVRTEHVERGADGPAAALAENEHDMIGQRRADALEEGERQIRCRVVAAIRSRVAMEEE